MVEFERLNIESTTDQNVFLKSYASLPEPQGGNQLRNTSARNVARQRRSDGVTAVFVVAPRLHIYLQDFVRTSQTIYGTSINAAAEAPANHCTCSYERRAV
jgi:hypothetical protein